MQHNLIAFNQNPKSLFISFEGIEGSGKSTQIQYLKEYLELKKYSVLLLREPGGSKFGEKLRSAILESAEPISPLAEAHLFASSRAQLLTEKILPFLAQNNTVVLLDRYIDSSIAYQGIARGLGIKTILDIHSHSPLNIVPNLTFYLKIDLETSEQRQIARGDAKDYFEKENHNFHNKLISGFEQSSEIFKERIEIIDAKGSLEDIRTKIRTSIDKVL